MTPKITMIWNRREIKGGQIIINYEKKNKTSPALLDQISDLQQKVDTLIKINKNNNSQSSTSLTLQPQTLTSTTTTPTTTTPITTTTQQTPSVPLSIKGHFNSFSLSLICPICLRIFGKIIYCIILAYFDINRVVKLVNATIW